MCSDNQEAIEDFCERMPARTGFVPKKRLASIVVITEESSAISRVSARAAHVETTLKTCGMQLLFSPRVRRPALSQSTTTTGRTSHDEDFYRVRLR
jgi:hypothetical protein